MKNRRLRFGSFALLFSLILPGLALAQQKPAGVVTALKGKAQLTRAAAKSPLRFKDGVILRDTIDTQEKSLARILFGGKSTVTVRELSRLEVREETLPGGATRTIHDLSDGGILVHVARQLMRPGDEVQIRTPNAVAAVRGSIIFALYNAALNQTFMAMLTGNGVITPQGLPPITLTPLQSVDITPAGVTRGTITQARANGIIAESDAGKGVTSEDEGTGEGQLAEAGAQQNGFLDAVDGDGEPFTPPPPPPEPPCSACDPQDKPAIVISGTTVTPDTAFDFTVSGTAITLVTGQTVKTFSGATSLSGTSPFVKITDGANVTTPGVFIKMDSAATVTLGRNLLTLNGGSILTAGGSLLDMTDATLTVTGALADISGSSTLKNTAGPVIKISGGSLTADSLADTDGSNTVNLTGTLLDLTNTTVTLRLLVEEGSPDNDNFTHTLAADEPIIKLTNSTLKLTETTSTDENTLVFIEEGEETQIVGGIETFKGLALVATDSTLELSEGLLEMKGKFTSDSTSALVQITSSTVDNDDDLIIVKEFSGTPTDITMKGPLATVDSTVTTASTVTTDFDFFIIDPGALLRSETTDPFIETTGATAKAVVLTLGVDSTEVHFFNVDGSGAQFTTTSSAPLAEFSNTELKQGGTNLILFEATGTGTSFQPIKGTQASFTVNSKTASNPIGALFKATNESDIKVDTALKLDNALFEATLPVFELVSTSSTQTQITSDGTFADIGGSTASKVLLKEQFIALDKGLITVTSGPLLSLKNGSTMDVLGDFLKLINGSKINVVNGPLILVDGSGSSLFVGGALLDFAGTSGNTFIIKNSITVTATLNGIAVSEGTSGSITIGSSPILDTAGGNTLDITGTVIQTTGGGTVDITAGGV